MVAAMGFEDQKQALQGLWGQSGKDQLQWFVEEEMAIMVWKGSRRARSFRLTPGKQGELVWGSGKFVLDPAFASGHRKAIWLSGEDSSEVFTWEFVGIEGPSKENAPEPRVLRGGGRGRGRGFGKGQIRVEEYGKGGKGRGGKGSSKGQGPGETAQADGKSQVFQRHIDRADRVPRTYEEMLLLYGSQWSRMEILAYFMDCPAERGKGKSKGGKGAAKGKGRPGKGWGLGVTNFSAMGSLARRIDPADGKVYTWEELRSFYAPTYTKKQTEVYWEGCPPAGGSGMQGAEWQFWL